MKQAVDALWMCIFFIEDDALSIFMSIMYLREASAGLLV